MKFAWLNLVLQLTNRIYQRKQRIVELEGLAVAGNVFTLICLELLLALISLPLYINVRSQKIFAFFKEKGAYEKIIFDYQLRRILTLTGVGIVLFVWLIKLGLLLAVPSLLGPLKLYSISDLRSQDVDSVNFELAISESDFRTAPVSSDLTVPELDEVNKSLGKNYVFRGSGQPNSTIVLLLTDLQTAIYTSDIDASGSWKIEHLQKDFTLHEGNHSILLFAYDDESKTRSELSSEQFIKVKTSILDHITRNVDSLANWSLVIVIFIGVFLTFLTL